MKIKCKVYEVIPVTNVGSVLFMSKEDAENYQKDLIIASYIKEREVY